MGITHDVIHFILNKRHSDSFIALNMLSPLKIFRLYFTIASDIKKLGHRCPSKNGLEMNISKKASRQKAKKTQISGSSHSPKPKKSKKPKQLFDQIIFRDWCKCCGICSAFCPKNVIALDEDGAPCIINPDNCIGCRFCEIHCPDFAITIRKRPPESRKNNS